MVRPLAVLFLFRNVLTICFCMCISITYVYLLKLKLPVWNKNYWVQCDGLRKSIECWCHNLLTPSWAREPEVDVENWISKIFLCPYTHGSWYLCSLSCTPCQTHTFSTISSNNKNFFEGVNDKISNKVNAVKIKSCLKCTF